MRGRGRPAGQPIGADDHVSVPSDGCETWNSNKALYASLQADLSPSTPVKRTCRNIKTIPTPSGSRI